MKRTLIYLLTFFALHEGYSQNYDDFLGAGHDEGITLSSSDPTLLSDAVIDGDGLDHELQSTSRFLASSTLGYTMQDLAYAHDIGMESWIEEQMLLSSDSYAEATIEVIFTLYDMCQENLGLSCDENFFLNPIMWRYAFWDKLMHDEDQLRKRVAQALSEILVLSDRSELENVPHGVAAYYDILSRNAFGNYRDLLMDVTLNPSMGFYLSHLNNPKSIPLQNIQPDENFAREIMQLFTIGLYELNNDGSRKIDPTTGEWIPTYDNDDIKGLAKVFTGLSGSKWADDDNPRPVQFGRRFTAYSLLDPMAMYEDWHERTEKKIVGDFIIPANQPGLRDIEMAITHLFNHPNVGPFIGKQLIQRLVKSNPTDAYVDRVASVFNDNGAGTRGDLGAVIKAILLDSEAMECYWLGDELSGALRSPMQRYTQLLKGLEAKAETDFFWNASAYYESFAGQHTMSSPTVFNFYEPDYVPNSEFAYQNIVGPEYQILNSSTASNYVNYMLIAVMKDQVNYTLSKYGLREVPDILNDAELVPFIRDKSAFSASLSDDVWLSLSDHPRQLLDYLDLLLANGNLSEKTKTDIAQSITDQSLKDEKAKAHYAVFLTMIHPDFLIKK